MIDTAMIAGQPPTPDIPGKEGAGEEDCATIGAIPIEPWTTGLSDLPDASGWLEQSKNTLVLLRAAVIVNGKTKDELMAMFGNDGEEKDVSVMVDLMDKFQTAAESLQAGADIFNCAEARLVVAECALVYQDNEPAGAQHDRSQDGCEAGSAPP